ncbi:hypothetical protein COU58_00130 [Candidatus Pacearchaeota archaeon CG10_big_fil_rev_8_21_14_0_10_32_42]|nr:MAG: hypothetical protein COU58_00130 [Candidatus Pacearchaeota archaeon CG10_big_fil_rev_8_21_14_0_10_32_42]
MKPTEDYVRRCIEEVVPLVEEISELKCDLENFGVFPLSKEKLEKATKITGSVAGYIPGTNIFVILEESRGDENFIKILLGHEITHHAQDYSFPNFYSFKEVFDKKWKYNSISPLTRLIEGDATLIEQELSDRYFKNAKINFLGIPLIPQNWLMSPDYLSWAKILQKKFNGNRKDINELYTAPIEELVKIFGGYEK